MAKEAQRMIGVAARAVALLAVCLQALIVPVAGQNERPTSPTAQSVEKPRPIEMRDFVIYVTQEGKLREEVYAKVAYLYQSLNIAHLMRIHVNFLKPGSPGQDTLDAPEGYLYLKSMDLTNKHPFYKEIGGADAITTETFGTKRKAVVIHRANKDIDLLGRLSRRIVYRNSQGTVVSSTRAYRCAPEGRLYGIGNVQMIRPRPDTKDELVLSGETFCVDDQLTSKIVIRGSNGSSPKLQVRPLTKQPLRSRSPAGSRK